jgi:hypothetical protein
VWGVLGTAEERHVIPLDDLRDHHQALACWCRPRVDDGVIVHNSMDLREEYETGARRPS